MNSGFTSPVAFERSNAPRTRCCGFLGKLLSEAIPATTGASAAGISGSLAFAQRLSPFTLYWWISVCSASRTMPAVPENSITVRPAPTRLTWKPSEASQSLTA